jgi:hypothetical protein
MTATATVPTKNASRYLQQLSKHWSHKFEVTFDAQKSDITFPMGALHMEAQTDALVVTLQPTPEADMDRFKQVVADHLDRFAFKEAPLAFDWK